MKAEYTVHWLGQIVPACESHKNKLVNLGNFMGCTVSVTKCEEELQCTNCENEAKKASAANEAGKGEIEA